MINLQKPSKELQNGYKDKKRLAAIHELDCSVCYLLGIRQTSNTIAHHRIGMGLSKKASDLLTISLCENHHTGKEGIHTIPLKKWEEKYFSQEVLIEFTNKMLEDL